MRWFASVSTTGRISASDVPAELGQVRRLVRDLHPGRRDEVVEEARRDLALLGRQRVDRSLQVIGDDLAGAAERIERLGPQRRRSRAALDVPEALHHELEVRRLDPDGLPVRLDRAETARSELDPAGAHAVQDALDEHVLGVDVLSLELSPALERAEDRQASGGSIEPVEA